MSESWDFDLEPVLEAAHTVGGRLYEDYAVEQAGLRYRPVLGKAFAIDMSGRGRVDFLGGGLEAWQAFAKDYLTYMHTTTLARLQRPHFLIADVSIWFGAGPTRNQASRGDGLVDVPQNVLT